MLSLVLPLCTELQDQKISIPSQRYMRMPDEKLLPLQFMVFDGIPYLLEGIVYCR